MAGRWAVFPQRRWPQHFGVRYERSARAAYDPAQLELHELVAPPAPSPQYQARANLHRVFRLTDWSQHDFARAMGCHERTLQRYLAGARIPEDRCNWLRDLESITEHGDRVLLVLKVAPAPRRVGARSARRDSG